MYVCLVLSIIMLASVKFENHVAVWFVFPTTLNLVIKHLMTGPKRNSEFCIPETLNVPWGEAATSFPGSVILPPPGANRSLQGVVRWETLGTRLGKSRRTLRSRGNRTHCFPLGQSWSVLYTSQLQKERRNSEKNCLPDVGWQINLPGLQGAQPDHVRVESSSCCFPRELVSFVRLRELVSFVRPRGDKEFWPTALDTFSSNQKTYFNWEV